MRVNHTANPQQ